MALLSRQNPHYATHEIYACSIVRELENAVFSFLYNYVLYMHDMQYNDISQYMYLKTSFLDSIYAIYRRDLPRPVCSPSLTGRLKELSILPPLETTR